MSVYIIIGAVVLVFVVLVLITVLLLTKKNKKVEPEASILDVDNEGVNNNHEFSYGYEKEATVVMDPVNPNMDPSSIETTEENKIEPVVEESDTASNEETSGTSNVESPSSNIPSSNDIPTAEIKEELNVSPVEVSMPETSETTEVQPVENIEVSVEEPKSE